MTLLYATNSRVQQPGFCQSDNNIFCVVYGAGLYYTYPKDRQAAVEAARVVVHNADAQPFNASANGEESRGLLNADDSTGRIESQLELASLRQEAFLTHK